MTEAKTILKKKRIRSPRPESKNRTNEKPFFKEPNTTIYVGNLSYKRDEDQIKKMFVYFGQVKSVKVIMDKKTKQRSGIAFVQMKDSASAARAVKFMDGKVTDNRTLKVSIAEERFDQNEQRQLRPIARVNKKDKSEKSKSDDLQEFSPVEKNLLKSQKRKQPSGLQKLHSFLESK